MKKILLFLLMLSSFVFGQKVILFDLNKYELVKGDQKGLVDYKVGDITFITDIEYNSKEQLFKEGSELAFERKEGFDGMTILIKRLGGTSGREIKKFIISDEYGESVSFERGSVFFTFGQEDIKRSSDGIEMLKIVFKNKEMSIFRNNELVKSLSLSHMDKITKIEYFKTGSDEIYDFKIIAEN